MEESNQEIRFWAEKMFNFLKEDKHLGAVTWLTTVFVTVSVALLKFLKFVSESGSLAYWGISPSAINMASDNILYDIIMTVIFAFVVFVMILIPYFILKSKMQRSKKGICICIITIVLTAAMFLGSNAREIIHNNSWGGVFAFIIADILFIAMFFAPSIIFLVSARPQKKQTKPLTKKSIVILIALLMVSNVLYFYFLSYFSTKSQTRYRITTEGYAIVYETNELYYLVKYNSDTNELCKEQQKVISKIGVEYTWHSDVGVKK